MSILPEQASKQASSLPKSHPEASLEDTQVDGPADRHGHATVIVAEQVEKLKVAGGEE